MYRRTCHCDLRSSTDAARCPECGRDFHPLDPPSFLAERPTPRQRGDRLRRVTWIAMAAAGAAYAVRLLIALTGGGH